MRSDDVVASALSDSAAGVPDAENAAKHGVAIKTIHLARSRRDVYALSIVNDERYPALNAGIADLMRAVKPNSRPHSRRRPGAVLTTVSWKHWPRRLPQHGPGRKNERVLELEGWQRILIETHPADFLRGLFHSGRAQLVTRQPSALLLANIQRPYSWRRSPRRKADVALLDELIGRKS